MRSAQQPMRSAQQMKADMIEGPETPETPVGDATIGCGSATAESAKRFQILNGARRCFLASGFDAASMGEIAREAKVSKGTLYVYFDSKEALFSALVEEAKQDTAERLQRLDEDEGDVRVALIRFAEGLITKLTRAEHVAVTRMIIGASERFPEIARSFFEAGPAYSARRLAEYLRARDTRGTLSVADPERAAWQFLGMCNHPVVVAVMLGGQTPPSAEEATKLAEAAVDTFYAAYRPKG